MRARRKPKVIAREIHLNESGLHIDGVYLPWEISNTVDVESRAPDFHEVTVTFFAERVFVEPVPGSHVTGTCNRVTTTEPCQDREDWQTTDEVVTWPPDTHPPLSRDGGESETVR